MRRGDFGAPKVGLLFQPFSLGPPFEEFQKMAEFGVFAKFGHNSDLRALLEARFAPELLVRRLDFKRILINGR